MKTLKVLAASLVAFVVCFVTLHAEVKEVKIKTSAECEMCKTAIEKAVNKLSGIEKSNLDYKTRILTVKYDNEKTTLDKIKTAVSKAGYDADEVKADKKAFRKLPKCCQKEAKEPASNGDKHEGCTEHDSKKKFLIY